jgi:CheY-like chemotaxis protein
MKPDRCVVMVVDDDPDTQTYMATVLARNYGVVTAAGGAEMWSRLETHTGGINLILMDLTLAAGEDGIELTRQLRAHPRWGSIPVVALTAHASDDVRNRALAAGCAEYVSKPIDRRRLFALIDALT